MARPLNKTELVDFTEREYSNLMSYINTLTEEQRDSEPVFSNRTAKDIIAHLYAWQLLELNWYTEGMKGLKPAIPAPGFTFKDTPALNEKLYQEYKTLSWKDLVDAFNKSHKKLLNIVESHNEEELFTKKKYDWTGTSNMAVYFRSALWSHYIWAIDLIRKHFKLAIIK